MKLRTRGSSRLLIGVVPDGASRGADDEMRRKFLDEVMAAGMRPEAVDDLVHDAVRNDRFRVFTDLNMVTVLTDKHDSIMENRNPVPPMVSAHRRPRQSHKERQRSVSAPHRFDAYEEGTLYTSPMDFIPTGLGGQFAAVLSAACFRRDAVAQKDRVRTVLEAASRPSTPD